MEEIIKKIDQHWEKTMDLLCIILVLTFGLLYLYHLDKAVERNKANDIVQESVRVWPHDTEYHPEYA